MSNPDLLNRLRLGETAAFEEIYKACFFKATSFVLMNSGTEQDARDLFQEALFVFFKNLQDPSFVLTTSAEIYLKSIVRKKWLYELRTRKSRKNAPPFSEDIREDGSDSDEKHRLIAEMIKTLKSECQELIQYAFYQGLNATEIAQLMGYAEGFVKVKKHRCLEALREKTRNHPIFRYA